MTADSVVPGFEKYLLIDPKEMDRLESIQRARLRETPKSRKIARLAATEAALLTSEHLPPGTKEALAKPVARELRQWMSRKVPRRKPLGPAPRQNAIAKKKKKTKEVAATPTPPTPAAPTTVPVVDKRKKRTRKTEAELLQRPTEWIDFAPGLRPKRKTIN